MPMPSFAFSPQGQPIPDNGGMAQYQQQGQVGINPGQVALANNAALASAGTGNLAKALQGMQQGGGASNGTQFPAEVSQSAMGAGAAMNPITPSGENTGGVGPTQQNAALAQGLMNAVPQQGMQPGYQSLFGNMFGGGGG